MKHFAATSVFLSFYCSVSILLVLGPHLRQHFHHVQHVIFIWCKPEVVFPGPAASPEKFVRDADSQGLTRPTEPETLGVGSSNSTEG